MIFRASGVEVAVQPMTEQFPPYEAVMPRGEKFHVLADPAALNAAMKQMPRDAKGVRLAVNGVIDMSAECGGRAARVKVPLVDSTHSGADLLIGVDHRYLAEALAPADGLATLRFEGPLDPVVVEPDDQHKAVIMPIRI